MSDFNQRLRDIFQTALDLSGEARSQYLSEACGRESKLRERVESLLSAHEDSTGILNTGGDLGAATLGDELSEGPGTLIGRYKILQVIGEGGMGVVYMAEQTRPVVRKVALKIIKLGMDTKQVVARFEAERQALALMDHPNIAKVLDAGATDTGRPYFVMELVKGVPVTDYCDKNKLSTKQRLELFIPVCQAIQHAHQKGIIHRDIKPSNVMVTLHDGQPVPKVIDFGIAKATNQRLTEKTLFTNYAQMIGTPTYMSPEQAEMSGLDVDTRTDVYSLGVLLYELLTGTTPFTSKELLSLGYGEMQRIIAEHDPQKPSTRLSTMVGEQQTEVAGRRSIDPEKLPRQIAGDLDWIVMKALEKDRTRRYEAVSGLMEDLGRHLGDEPVMAVAPSFTYQVLKLYRKYRRLMRVASVVAVLLLAATVISINARLGERQARAMAVIADEARQRADALAAVQRVRATEVVGVLNDYFQVAIPQLSQQGHQEAIRQLLMVSNDLADELKEAPLEGARLRFQMGETYRIYLGDKEEAVAQYLRSEDLAAAVGPLGDNVLKLARANRIVVEGGDEVAVRLRHWVAEAMRPESLDVTLAAFALSELAAQSAWRSEHDKVESLSRECLLIAPKDSTHAAIRLRVLTALGRSRMKRHAPIEAMDACKMAVESVALMPPGTYHRSKETLLRLFAYAAAVADKVEEFERALAQLEANLQDNDLIALTIQSARGEAYARRGDWEKGYALITEVASQPGAPILTWQTACWMALLLQDEAGFRDLLIYGLSRFGAGADGEMHYRLAAQLGASQSNLREHPLVDEYLRRTEASHFSKRIWFLLMKSALLLSDGHDGEAERVCDQFVANAKARGQAWVLSVAEFYVSAIKSSVGKLAEGEAAYARGLTSMSRHFLDRSEPYDGFWWDEAVGQELDRRLAARHLREAGLMADDMWHLKESPGE